MFHRCTITRAAGAVLLGAGLMLGTALPALAAEEDPGVPGDVTTKINTDCGVAVVSIDNTTDYIFAADWTASAASTAGQASGVLVADGRDGGNPSSDSQTIRFPEDIGEVTVALVVEKGAERDDYPAPKSAVVTTDCPEPEPEPEPTYPQECEIEGGVDDGESGTQASAEADCVSDSPGYESDEVGGPCVLETGEPGGGAGVVTEDGACEEPPADGTKPPADKENPKTPECEDGQVRNDDGDCVTPPAPVEPDEPAGGDEDKTSNVGMISDDGQWVWNGDKWVPVDTDDGAAPEGGIETGDGGTEELAYTGAGNALGLLAGGLGLVGAGALAMAAGPRLLRRS